ncbi:hypothetical protein D9M71_253790 [compost metagenome]
MENQRGGDVVRQVADHAQTVGGGAQGVEVEFQGIALVQAKIFVAGKLAVEDRHQVLVQLDHVQLCAAAEQAFSKRALARADLQHAIALTGVDGPQDTVDHASVMQEVLAEALARPVLVVLGHSRVSAIW